MFQREFDALALGEQKHANERMACGKSKQTKAYYTHTVKTTGIRSKRVLFVA